MTIRKMSPRTVRIARKAAIVLLVVGLPVAVNFATPWPGALLARFIISSHKAAMPPKALEAQDKVTVDRDVPVDAPDIPRLRMDVYRPKAKAGQQRPIVVWVHGGAYIGGDKNDAKAYATRLAAAGYVVATLNYSRPPEATYPVPVAQVNAALGYLAKHAATYGSDGRQMFLAGNSSGAQIASQVAALETSPGLARAMHITPAISPAVLRGTLLFSGAYDMQALKSVHFPFLRSGLWSYTGVRDWWRFSDIDQLSTVRQATGDYPPSFLAAGDADGMEQQAYEFKDVLRSRGVPVTTQLWRGSNNKLPHDYQFDFSRPQAEQTYQAASAFLRAYTEKTEPSS